jgi:hypothetical protein
MKTLKITRDVNPNFFFMMRSSLGLSVDGCLRPPALG